MNNMIPRLFTNVFLLALGSALTFTVVRCAPSMRPATSKPASTAPLTEKIGGAPLGSIVYSADMGKVVLLLVDRHKLEGFLRDKKSCELALATSSARISQNVFFQTKDTEETLIILEVYIPNLMQLRNGELKSAVLSL